MTTHRKLGIAIILVPALLAAIGVVMGILSITSAVGLAVVGLLIGTGVARGRFSSAPNATRKY
ncbi:MAG: hypothetical protein ABSG72_09860 [Candidatus Sulfotelmatobacter sp.]|jgi:hypothetical protein